MTCRLPAVFALDSRDVSRRRGERAYQAEQTEYGLCRSGQDGALEGTDEGHEPSSQVANQQCPIDWEFFSQRYFHLCLRSA